VNSGHGHRPAAEWSALADTIQASLGDCVHPTGRWQRSPGDSRVDAALLLPVIRGALPADDPRAESSNRVVLTVVSGLLRTWSSISVWLWRASRRYCTSTRARDVPSARPAAARTR
jgi:hypothetical protein